MRRQFKKKVLNHLWDAYDRMEGEYSGIPECCVESYLDGRTAWDFEETLSEKDKKKYKSWHYVPCDQCFKENNKHKLKLNGVSIRGQMLRAIIESYGKGGR